MKHLNYFRYLMLPLIAVLLGTSCMKEEEPESINNLCGGFWIEEGADELIVKFNDSGSIYNYVYAVSDEGGYDAYYRSTNKYSLDAENSVLCLIPDFWYDIYVLTSNTLVLANEKGDNLTFRKIPDDSVTIITREVFSDKYGGDN